MDSNPEEAHKEIERLARREKEIAEALLLTRQLIGAMAGRLAVILPEEERMLKELDALLDKLRSPFSPCPSTCP